MPGTPKKWEDVKLLNKMPEDMILTMIEAGKSIADICIDLGVSKRAFDIWVDENDLSSKITHARTRAADLMACETIKIADAIDEDNPARPVQRIRTRQWLAERWDPKTYGQQKTAQITVNVQDMRLAALRHVEVVEDLSTEVVPKLSTNG
jgi:hypothetical protein